jgi:hypothetical protein
MKPNERVIGDHARAMGKLLLDLIAHNYREEEHHDIWEAFTEVCRNGILSYEIEANRMYERLYGPGRN